ncbi:MAG: ATP-binding protein [Akkermansiaceae bacterium]|nr:ATP-binding protein [Akkermansiaceae bacterium]MCF7730123.1 ATP-binding protein [Akkermansiaceae bacterium]
MSLRIRTLNLHGIRQFRDVTFDFTDPKAGKPLDRICLIGGNGTGKSTILRLLASDRVLGVPSSTPRWAGRLEANASMHVEFENGDSSASLYGRPNQLKWGTRRDPKSKEDVEELAELVPLGSPDEQNKWITDLRDLATVYCPPDSELPPNSSKINDLPAANLNDALTFLKKPPTKFMVGQDKVADFWKLLIALIKDREARLIEYNRLPENQDRTIAAVEREFLAQNPNILKELAGVWEPILIKAGLRFDYEKASQPIQLNDNLKAYIYLAAENAVLPYAELSTGIRSSLFRLGHLFTIFRHHSGKGGIVLIDEPENSLYPDFLLDLLAHYERTAPGAQMFFATHSPIVAAQFKPEERFILEFDPDRGVVVRRGVTPEGDNPNDVLLKDFAVRTLYGEKGLASWNRFLELSRLIESESDPKTRKALVKEYLELGRTYNFDPHNELFA